MGGIGSRIVLAEQVVVLHAVSPDRYRLVLQGGGGYVVVLLTHQAALALMRKLAEVFPDTGPKKGGAVGECGPGLMWVTDS